jgi:hypothetical protein
MSDYRMLDFFKQYVAEDVRRMKIEMIEQIQKIVADGVKFQSRFRPTEVEVMLDSKVLDTIRRYVAESEQKVKVLQMSEKMDDSIKALHDEAMNMADQAFDARRKGDVVQAMSLFQRAYQMEIRAARGSNKQPVTGVLFRSAASLAFLGGLHKEAEDAIEAGLNSNPPEWLVQELGDLCMTHGIGLPTMRGTRDE